LYQIERPWRGRLGSLHAAGQMGTKSKSDESQNAANGDENAKYSNQNTENQSTIKSQQVWWWKMFKTHLEGVKMVVANGERLWK